MEERKEFQIVEKAPTARASNQITQRFISIAINNTADAPVGRERKNIKDHFLGDAFAVVVASIVYILRNIYKKRLKKFKARETAVFLLPSYLS